MAALELGLVLLDIHCLHPQGKAREISGRELLAWLLSGFYMEPWTDHLISELLVSQPTEEDC